MVSGHGSFDSDDRGGVMLPTSPTSSYAASYSDTAHWQVSSDHVLVSQSHQQHHKQARTYTNAAAAASPQQHHLPQLPDVKQQHQPHRAAPLPRSAHDRQQLSPSPQTPLTPSSTSPRDYHSSSLPSPWPETPHTPATDPGHGDTAPLPASPTVHRSYLHASHSPSASQSSLSSSPPHSYALHGAVPSFVSGGAASPVRPSSPSNSVARPRARSRPSSTSAPRARSRSRPASPASRRRAVSPHDGSAAPQPARSRIPTPTRPRAYSASAAEAQETLSDDAPPPLPPLPRHRQRQHSHAHSSPPFDGSDDQRSARAHARALESALHASTTSHTHPRQAFPAQPPTPPLTAGMSVSSHTQAPEAPHRLVNSHSGIPVLKTRARSTQRTPSPEFPSGAERLADELPPFRVDLDAALAEIEDELEIRAQERYALAQPASPSLSASPTFPSPSPAAATASSTPTTSRLRQPKQKLRVRPAIPPGSSNGSATSTPARRSTTGAAKPRAGSTGSGPATPKGRLGRASSASAVSPARGVRGSATPRRRQSSDVTQSLGPGSRPRVRGTSASPGYGGTPNGTPNGTPSSAIPVPKRPPRSQSGPLVSSPSSVGSKLGPVAHVVPPESSFTPPKGADWDDVVLPTVAKKTGIVVAGSHGWRMADGGTPPASHSLRYSDDDDDDSEGDGDYLLAVEWDKDGTPLRWERQRRPAGLSDADFAANRAAAGAIYDLYSFTPENDFGAPPATPGSSPDYATPPTMDFGPASPVSPVSPATPGAPRVGAPPRPQRASTRRTQPQAMGRVDVAAAPDDGVSSPVSLRMSAAHATGLDAVARGPAPTVPSPAPAPAPAPAPPAKTSGPAANRVDARKRRSKPAGLDGDDVTKSACACVIM